MDRQRRGLLVALVAPIAALVGVVSATRVTDEDLDEGLLWAFAEMLSANTATVLLAAMLGTAAVVVVSLRADAQNDHRAELVGHGASAFAAGAAVALVLLGPWSYYRLDIAIIVVVLAVALLVVAALWRRRRTLASSLRFAAAILLAALLAGAASFEDNGDRPVPFALGLAICILPFVAAALSRDSALRSLSAAAVIAVHAVGLVFVLTAASSCQDDDCIPVPPWFAAATVAVIWFSATHLVRHNPRSDEPKRLRTLSDAVVIAMPSLLLTAAAFVVAGFVDTDREPTAFAATSDAVVERLPGLLAWTSERVCDRFSGDQEVSSTTVVVVGGDRGSDARAELCFAEFDRWYAAAPLAVVETDGVRQTFDPFTGRTESLPFDFTTDRLEPAGTALELRDLPRGRFEIWVEREQQSTRLLRVDGGIDYSVRRYGLSDDGSWAFVTDHDGRLLVMPTDGSQPPTVLAEGVGYDIEWGPGATYRPPVAYLRDPGVWRYLPDGVDQATAAEAFFAQERQLDENLSVELVIVESIVSARFVGLPSIADTEGGYCVTFSSRIKQDPARRTDLSIAVGDGGPDCVGDATGLFCGTSLTVPTIVTAQMLSSYEVRIDAAVSIPVTVPSYETIPTSLILTFDDWSPGPITADLVPHVDLGDVSC